VIIDEGFWVKSQRDDIKKRILSIGAKTILYYVNCPIKKMRERVVNRSKKPPVDSFEITGEMFDQYLKFWEPPEKDEEFILTKQF
jgi:predicted kinase